VLALSAFLGGLFWRIRGGFLGHWNPFGTQVARLLGTLPLAFLALSIGGLIPALIAMLHMPALMLMGWWDAFSEDVNVKKSLVLTTRGSVQGLIVGLPLAYFGYSLWFIAVLGGAMFGPLHYLCTKYLQNVPDVTILKSKFIDGPLSVVEITYGIVLYITFILAIG